MNKLDVLAMYNLDYIVRYSNVPRIKNETVAAHSFFVALEVYKLYEEYEFDLSKAINIALTHDFPEAYIDDVNHKIKKEFKEVKIALEKAEKKIVKDKFPIFIQNFINEYTKCDTTEALIVHLADVLQCKTYSSNEMRLGNLGYMQQVFDESMQREIDLKSKLLSIKRP